MNGELWAYACGGWIVGMFQARVITWIALTYNQRKGGAAMLRIHLGKFRGWVGKNFVALAIIIVFVSNGAGWFVVLGQNADNERQDLRAAAQDREIARVAVCTGKYLSDDAEARDARSEAVKPRDEAEAAFIKAVADLRGSDGSDPEGDAKKVAAIFAATSAFEKAKAELDEVRAVDYPTYTCDKDR